MDLAMIRQRIAGHSAALKVLLADVQKHRDELAGLREQVEEMEGDADSIATEIELAVDNLNDAILIAERSDDEG